MSLELAIYFESKMLPTSQQWRQAVVELGFDVVIEDDIGMKEFSGFLPATHKGKSSGFEYYFNNVTGQETKIIDIPKKHDCEIVLRTSPNSDELACSVVSITALCILTNGIIYEPYEGICIKKAECRNWVESEYLSNSNSHDSIPKQRKMEVMDFIDRFVPLGFLFTWLIRKLKV